jgi:Kef-type K+ transport system membrane component KefB
MADRERPADDRLPLDILAAAIGFLLMIVSTALAPSSFCGDGGFVDLPDGFVAIGSASIAGFAFAALLALVYRRSVAGKVTCLFAYAVVALVTAAYLFVLPQFCALN